MIENHVVSLELSKRLHKLGIIKDSVFIYNYPDDSPLFRRIYDDKGKDIVSAYLATELLAILPSYILNNLYYLDIEIEDGEFSVRYLKSFECSCFHYEDHVLFQNALAKMVIHLVENKLMEVEK